MYLVYYLFYKVNYDAETDWGYYTDVKAKSFGSPQEENSFTSEMRKQGYMTKRVPEDIYRLACCNVKVV